MRLDWLQHVPYEGPGSIEAWAARSGHALRATRLHRGEAPPPIVDVRMLIVMGGPMSVHDEGRFPWLAAEKRFVESAVAAGRPVLGVCLGAQVLAEVLGARVRRNPEAEIGWFPVWRVPDPALPEPAPPERPGPVAPAPSNAIAAALPDGEPVFHWHGETFDTPAGARRLARSEACGNQAFLWGDRVLGLQFHLEATAAGVEAMIEACAAELVPAPHIQTAAAMREACAAAPPLNARLDRILDALAGAAAG